ncbi:hypothetical protein RSK20926_05252 [Roseobacter sp. SK209-2-6]|uniref:M56 family metallopeptidase n=1 Tax=Roseobacter sp. SK209-2-6 TaxID=388739 RepID=UPI0000F3CE20|nr:M56 family metallopeptidase [Roseobacter sp. SK209-2-6]EBA15992.1 hypothetical protein RSK20926_05252 [Roseobacter sp. SK209-2-6]
MTADAFLNSYIDLNLLVLAGTLLWLSTRKLLSRTRLAHAYRAQLRLMNFLTILLVLSPFLMIAFTRYVMAHPPNLSDLLVAQYLQGNVNMSAASFETLLGLREDTVRQLATQQALWTKALAATLALGALIVTLHLLLSVWRLALVLRRAHLWKSINGVQILISDETRVAYSTRDLWRRYVVLPAALLQSPKDLQLTLAHEMQHFRQRDIECEFLIEFLRPLLFWNPAYYLWRREIRKLREFACDQALSQRTGLDLRAYCECLIRACGLAAQEPVYFVRRSPTVALVDRRETRNGSNLHQRIVALTSEIPEEQAPASWAAISGLLILMIIATAMLMQRPGDWSHDRLMLSTIVNLERMAERSSAGPAVDAVSILQGSFLPSSSQ